MKKLLLSLPILALGCAYVEDARLYTVQPFMPSDKAVQLTSLIEKRLIQKGLLLKSKYHDAYPEDVLVTELEIPRRPEDKRRYPMLIVSLKDSHLVQIRHSEWWLNNFTTRYKPEDYVKKIIPELRFAAKKELNMDIELVLTEQNLS